MTRKNNFRLFAVCILFIIGFQACHDPSSGDHRRSGSDTKMVISLKTFKTDSGYWGYEILADKKVYIHQEIIPALDGNRPFPGKKDALKVGRAVMQKIKTQQSPTLSKEEVLTLLDLEK